MVRNILIHYYFIRLNIDLALERTLPSTLFGYIFVQFFHVLKTSCDKFINKHVFYSCFWWLSVDRLNVSGGGVQYEP